MINRRNSNRLFFTSLYAIVLIAFFVRCDPGEIPVQPNDQEQSVIDQVVMGQNYQFQIYYDLGSASVVKKVYRDEWDIGIMFSDSGGAIILNSARGGAAADAGTSDFMSDISLNDLQWKRDVPSGNIDSAAIGTNWRGRKVFVIDRGVDRNGNHTGYRKIAVVNFSTESCTLRVAHLDGTADTLVVVQKLPDRNFVAFSFDSNAALDIEPPRGSWDLCFTQYTHLFSDPPIPYVVTGVLLNRFRVAAAVERNKPFAEIKLADVEQYHFQSAINTIGYDWKTYNFSTGKYSVDASKSFIIRDTDGEYYKLRFLDFYTATGEKGAPKFEFVHLQ